MAPSGRRTGAELNLDAEPHSFTETHGVLTTTSQTLVGYKIVRELGVVYGLSVRSRNWGADIISVLRSIGGGELKYLTNLLYSTRNHASDRMIGECLSRGGNAVIAMRFDIAEGKYLGLSSGSTMLTHVVMNFTQVGAYGTAVIVEKEGEEKGVVEAKS
jgi:uncharacterized protein YbjQ (UPF0145 family)